MGLLEIFLAITAIVLLVALIAVSYLANQRIGEAKQQTNDTIQAFHEVESERNALEEEFQSYMNDAEVQMKEAQGILDQTEADKLDWATKANQFHKECTQLEVQCSKLEGESETLKKKQKVIDRHLEEVKETFQREKRTLEDALKSSQGELNHVHQVYEAAQASTAQHLKEFEGKLTGLQETLKHRELELVGWREKEKTFRQELERLHAEMEERIEEERGLRVQLEYGWKDRESAFLTTQSHLESQMQEATQRLLEERSRWQGERGELEQKNQDLSERLGVLETQRELVLDQAKKEGQAEEHARAQEALMVLEKQLADLAADRDEWRKRAETAQESNGESERQKVLQLLDELNQAKASKDSLRRELEGVKRSWEQLRKEQELVASKEETNGHPKAEVLEELGVLKQALDEAQKEATESRQKYESGKKEWMQQVEVMRQQLLAAQGATGKNRLSATNPRKRSTRSKS